MAKIATNTNHVIVKTSLCLLPPLLLAVVFYLHFQTQLSMFSPVCRCAGQPAAVPGAVVDRLRASATFLPLKDTRQGAETWFISTLNATAEPEGEARNLVFPSPASAGRLLCLAAPSRHDGAKNAYALAWRDALPRGSALLPGLAFVSETAYDHTNIWHGLTSLVPFASWHARSGCRARPARWIDDGARLARRIRIREAPARRGWPAATAGEADPCPGPIGEGDEQAAQRGDLERRGEERAAFASAVGEATIWVRDPLLPRDPNM